MNSTRSFSGCWTCRLRRKKCDEKHPICGTCAALHITCYFDQERPQWMDGGASQDAMAEQLKREVREKAQLRRGERTIHPWTDQTSNLESSTAEWILLPRNPPQNQTTIEVNVNEANSNIASEEMDISLEPTVGTRQQSAECALTGELLSHPAALIWPETILLTFYLDHLFPFMYPFYRPSVYQGGRAWILEMMMKSPVMRQAILCPSSYFYSLARGTSSDEMLWETAVTQTKSAFETLRSALQVITGSSIIDHLHGAVRIMASIMQVQRFEIAISSFDNCQAHLNAAVTLFRQILDSAELLQSINSSLRWDALMTQIRGITLKGQCVRIPSAEQSTFIFSSTLLIFDDIIASTVLQERPKLFDYHRELLFGVDGSTPPIDMASIVGCQNWVLLHIGDIADLVNWKQRCKIDENLDVMELVHRATTIKHSLETQLAKVETEIVNAPTETHSLLRFLNVDSCPSLSLPHHESVLVTRVWAHAALIYLHVTVSGWQPASSEVRHHVSKIIDLLTQGLSSPVLVRSMVWPFCIAGCLAEAAQEDVFRSIVDSLQPPSVFRTVRKALEIMEDVWQSRQGGDNASRDLASCFCSQGELVLLV
ncbi:fungal-specific transcription factor domain-containing protein [Dendryphion nanum]|uniref:Fungal-specific transcription factor domain-containing protein n=1 Tax=Dendryphion nanum TaxID=256645 RepID=A0A9P9IUT5_9PLEO|nr:fungal-specific transcription factor domain-containing protein [Dendryphion nanum]